MSIYATDENKKLYKISGGSGTKVTLNGQGQKEWSADFVENEKTISGENNFNPIIHNNDAPVVFAESERQKSKNLLVYPYANATKTNNGITFTDNGDGSVTINGTNNGGGNSNFFFTSYKYKFKKGTYTLGNFASENNACSIVAYDGKYYHQAKANSSVTFTISEDVSEDVETYIYMGVVKNDTFTFNNVVVKPMFVSGTELGEYQPYNGAIVHEKDIADVEHIEVIYDKSSSDGDINWGYSSGISSTLVDDNTLANGKVQITHPSIDISKYKGIEVVTVFGNENLTAKGYDYIYNSYRCSGSGYTHSLSSSAIGYFDLYLSETELIFRPRRDYEGALTVLNSQYCYISKIRGILK